MQEQLYYGLSKIAERLNVSTDIARSLIKRGLIRAVKPEDNKNSPWVTNETMISADIERMPGRLDDAL